VARITLRSFLKRTTTRPIQHFTKARSSRITLPIRRSQLLPVSAVQYARTLLPSFESAALVFAAVSIEITWKSAVLKPLVAGVVHIEALGGKKL